VIELSGAGEVDLRIELAAEAVELEPLVVTAARQSRLERSGFFERRRFGMGHTRTREEIEALSPFRFSDIFRTIPGVQVVPVGRGTGSGLRMRGTCQPDLVLDGVTLSGVSSVDDIVSVHDVEAVEVHSVSTAPAHIGRSGCGMVMVWTRDGSRADGRPLTWRRVLAAAGFVAAVFLLAR
jgi:outer membrane cobalamin receptor